MSYWRLQVLVIGFFFLGFLVVSRLFYWQVVHGAKLKASGESQYWREEEIPAIRGQILTSDGFSLVTNKQVYLVYANLSQINFAPVEIAARLAPILSPDDIEKEKDEVEQRLERKDVVWITLARKVSRETKEQIEKLGIAGIGFQEEEERFYPEGSMSAQLLGFVGQDASGHDKGYFGLEGFYDRTLAGRSGLLRQEKDASGRPILIGDTNYEEEMPGRDLKLYLNRSIQFTIEEKLKEALVKYGAKAGWVVVLDPFTGGVLAMASFPSYDPVNYAVQDKSLFPNPVVAQTFEPGSILKIMVMASAFQEKVVSLSDRCPCSGPKTIGEYTIQTWDNKYRSDSTPSDIIVHSDNVGMVWTEERLGGQKLVSYLDHFGFGEQTGIDLEDETSLSLRPWEKWVPIDLATASFGQGIAVTPIQMVRAAAVIANGGKLIEPHLVSEIQSLDKNVSVKPKIIRDVISSETAKTIKDIMVEAVETGEAKWAKPKGYKIAGKTGTAQIPIAGHYDKDKTIASFIGFAPADHPQFVMLVSLSEPTSSPWGSETAAPLWFSIAKDIFYQLKIPPDQ